MPSPPDSSVFISYARADDKPPPDDDKAKGWVTYFWEQLRFELTDRGAKQAELWLDRYQIEPQEAFTEEIEKALVEAKLIVTILSRNWIQSDWCQRELETFDHIHQDASDCFIPIFKHELDRELLPALMQDRYARDGYKFYRLSETGKTDEFYWRGLRDWNAYFDLIKQIAIFIIKKLDGTKPLAASFSLASSGRTVYVALTDSELNDARQRIVNDLTKSDIIVLPDSEAVPDTIEALESFVKDALSKAEITIHLLGEKRGITVEGSEEPIVDYQMRLARQTTLPRVFCISYQLNPDEFIKNRIGAISRNEEIFGESITSLSQWLRQRLRSSPQAMPSHLVKAEQILVIAAHPDDQELAIKLARNLQGHGLDITLNSENETLSSVSQQSITLIPWGVASKTDILALISQLQVSSNQIFCLFLPAGNQAEKNVFFHKAVIAQAIDLPMNRQEGKQLLESLEILPMNSD